MTTGPAARTRIAAYPAESILSWMQGRTVTQGWDVICAIAYDQINEWFLQQYVERLSAGEDAVINGSVPQAGGIISIQAVNLKLGPPLISFSRTSPPGYLMLTINFLSGEVSVVQTNSTVTTVLSTQVITPGDEYALTGLVPLASVQGEVEGGHDVVIDVVKGESFAAKLDMPEGAQTLLGQFMKSWLVNNLNGYKYKLGTLAYADNGTNLKPAGTFKFDTQIDATDPADTGRLLLFIPTTYNPGGGAQTSLGLADIVPKGCSTALIISSRVLFQNILKSFYETTFSKQGVQAEASQKGPGEAYTLTLTAGAIDAGPHEYDMDKQNGVWTGTLFPKTVKDVMVPLSSVQLQATSNQLLISGKVGWTQDLSITWWAAGIHNGTSNHAQRAAGAVINCQTTASVTAVKDTVSLKGTPSINVSFDWANLVDDPNVGGWWQNLENSTAAAAQAVLTAFFQVPLPEVNAFAVSNLLFPGKNILDFQSAYVPGDMVLFGDVATPGVLVSPGSATLGPSQSHQFSATVGSGEAVSWSANTGTVSPSGLYTAPAVINQVQTDTVVAKSQNSGGAAALVTLVPSGAQVSPAFVLLQPAASQQFSATVAGAPHEPVTWSMEPEVGTLTSAGLYTAAGVTSPQAVTITARSTSNPSIQGTALAVLVATAPALVAVTPPEAPSPLAPSETLQFKATAVGLSDQTVKWSLLPSIGRITQGGLYIAPDTISAPQSVLVIATSALAPVIYGTALVTLAPGD